MTTPHKINGVDKALLDQIAAHRAAVLRTCHSKRRYADEHAARAVGIECMADGLGPRYIYKCRHCSGWHLTRQEQAPYFAADYLDKRGYK